MKKENGSALVGVLIGLIGFVLVVVALLFFSYVSASNSGVRMETDIKATYENNQNLLAQYSQKVMEVAQVPAMARDDGIRLARAAIEGRYGENGSQAVFQMLKEQNPTLDASLYRQIQQVVEGGRNEFQTGQTRLIDQKRAYTTALGMFWGGMWMRMAGFPKVNLDDYKIITTDRTQETFKAGKESAPLQLRPATSDASK